MLNIIGIIFFYWISGLFILIGLWFLYAVIHITGILLGILPEPWFGLESVEYLTHGKEHLVSLLGLIVGFGANTIWNMRGKKLREKSRILREKRDKEWEKELKYETYKSFYEREKKKKKKNKKKRRKK